MTKQEPVLKDLQQTYQNLKTEKKEYQKYKQYLDLEIKNLIDANEKLLSCLKDRQQTYAKLNSQEIEIDDLIENQTLEMQNKDKIKNLVHELDNLDDKDSFISPIVSKSESNLKSIKTNVMHAKGEPMIDILLLSNKSKHLKNENSNLQNEIDQFNELLKQKVNNNEIPKAILSGFNLYVNKCEAIRNKQNNNLNKSNQKEKKSMMIPIIKPTLQNNTKSFFHASLKNKQLIKPNILSQNDDHFYTENGGLNYKNSKQIFLNKSLNKMKSHSEIFSSTNALIDVDKEMQKLNDQQRKTSLNNLKKKLLPKGKKSKDKTMAPKTLFELLDIDLNSGSEFSTFYDSDYHNDRHNKQKEEEQQINDLFNIDIIEEEEEDISTENNDKDKNNSSKNSKEDLESKNRNKDLDDQNYSKKSDDDEQKNNILPGLITHSGVEPYHSDQLAEYVEEEEEEEYFEEEEDFVILVQRKTQTVSSIRNKRAEAIIHELSEIEKCQGLMDKISQVQIQMNNVDSDLLELTKNKDIKEMRIETIKRRLKMLNVMTTIDIPPPKHNQYNVSSTQIQPEIGIDALRDQLNQSVSRASNHFLFIQSKRDLEQNLLRLNVEINLIKQENEKKDQTYQKLMSRLHIIDPYTYNIEAKIAQPDEVVDPEILIKRNQKSKIKKKLEKRIEQLKNEYHSIETQMNDHRFFIKKNKKELYQKAKSPHLMVDKLCNQLKSDRIVLQGVAKRTAFVNVESNFLTEKLNEMDVLYGDQALVAFTNQVDLIENELQQTKTRYGQLVSKKGKRAIVLTNQAELTMFQQKINERINEIDVYKMRMNGIVSKVENQMRKLKHLNIQLPNPPEIWNSLSTTVKKKAHAKKL